MARQATVAQDLIDFMDALGLDGTAHPALVLLVLIEVSCTRKWALAFLNVSRGQWHTPWPMSTTVPLPAEAPSVSPALLVRWVAACAQGAPDAHLNPHVLPHRPIDGDVAALRLPKLTCHGLQRRLAVHLHGPVVGFRRVIAVVSLKV
jgi:hypothetical protein